MRRAEEKEKEARLKWKEGQPQKSVEKRMQYHARKCEKDAERLRKAEEALQSFKDEVQARKEDLERRVEEARERKDQNDAEMEKLIQEKRGEQHGAGGGKRTDGYEEALKDVNDLGQDMEALAEQAEGEEVKKALRLLSRKLQKVEGAVRRMGEE
jgi:hypothetical protein